MRSEQAWIDWCDEHPVMAGLMMLGVYALCWAGFIGVLWIAAGGIGVLREVFGA
jgi:hypothetical protein